LVFVALFGAQAPAMLPRWAWLLGLVGLLRGVTIVAASKASTFSSVRLGLEESFLTPRVGKPESHHDLFLDRTHRGHALSALRLAPNASDYLLAESHQSTLLSVSMAAWPSMPSMSMPGVHISSGHKTAMLIGSAAGIVVALVLCVVVAFMADQRLQPHTPAVPLEHSDYLDGQMKAYLPLQMKVHSYYEQFLAQILLAVLIFLNFAMCAARAELRPMSGGELEWTFVCLEWMFNVAFLCELCVNGYGNFIVPFWRSPWNVFDFIVVFASISSPLLGESKSGVPFVSVLRIFRAFRIFRVLRGVPALSLIVQGIIHALPGVGYTLLLLLFCAGIWAILGVSMFAASWPMYYSDFARAMVTQMQITTGDGWVRNIFRPIILGETPLGDFATGMFFIVYTFLTSIVLLNVLIATTFDGYSTASMHHKAVSFDEAHELLLHAGTWHKRKHILDRCVNSMPHWLCSLLSSQTFLLKLAGCLQPIRPKWFKDPEDQSFQEEHIQKLLDRLAEDNLPFEGVESPSARWMMDTYDNGHRSDSIPRHDLVPFVKYCLFMEFADKEFGEEAMAAREEASRAAREALEAQNPNRLPMQRLFKDIYELNLTQFLVAAVIMANFVICAIDAQMQPKPDSVQGQWLWGIELGISIFFMIELAVNMYGHFFTPFWKDPWNIFDVIVVACSVASLVGAGIPAISALRLLRAFRVLRLIKFMTTVANLTKRVFNAMPSIGYAFILLSVIVCIWAIMGVSLYGDSWPDFYGSFHLACLSQIQILTFDSWVSQLMRPIVEKEGIQSSVFFLTYVFLNSCVLLNMVCAIFIEHFKAPLPADDGDEDLNEEDESGPLKDGQKGSDGKK